jgi:tetratricopeptide (TPR) repeat protein
MIRSLLAVLAIGLITVAANGQAADAGEPGHDGGIPDRPELLRRIALYEAAEKSADLGRVGLVSMVKIYSNLTALYEDASMYPKAAATVQREIFFLRNGPQNELAEALSQEASLHSAMGDMKAAEKGQLEALRIRETVGDPVGIALAWNDLARVYVKKRDFKKGVDYAQKAMEVLGDDAKLDVTAQIGVRETLAFALCGVKKYGKAISLLKDAIERSRASYGEDSLVVGVEYYILGFMAWQSGDLDNGGAWMAHGTERMKRDLGWGHAVYLHAMNEYARFLRQRGQKQEAAAAEREVRMAQNTVDVGALGIPVAGLR